MNHLQNALKTLLKGYNDSRNWWNILSSAHNENIAAYKCVKISATLFRQNFRQMPGIMK